MRLVIKYGGSVLAAGAPVSLFAEVANLIAAGHAIVLVHGGGPEIDAALAAASVKSERVEGLRVTDLRTLTVAEAVLCGTLNKRIVRECLHAGIEAVGLSGQDGALLEGRRISSSSGADIGYVGEISRVSDRVLLALLQSGFTPVVAPVAVSYDRANALNVNADTSAGAIAAALRADAMVLLTDVARVLRDPKDTASEIQHFTIEEARLFADSPGCQNSMRPKVLAAADAVAGGAARACICAMGPGAIADALAGNATVVSR